MKLVVIESPYGSDDPKIVARNVCYARACVADSLKRGEAPYASHLFFTQEGILCDDVPAERSLGIEAGLAWGKKAELTVVYDDLGVSAGMKIGIERAEKEGRSVEFRSLETWGGQTEGKVFGLIADMFEEEAS